MENKLSREDIERVFFLHYGCDLFVESTLEYWGDDEGQYKEEIKTGRIINVKEYDRIYESIDQLKLSLKTISEITEEDKNAVCELAGYGGDNSGLSVYSRHGHFRRWIDLYDMTLIDDCYSTDHLETRP